MAIINNGFGKAIWQSKGRTAKYLKGERNTTYGINKFIVVCTGNVQTYLYIIFDPQGRQDEALHLLSAHSLMIDGKEEPFPGGQKINFKLGVEHVMASGARCRRPFRQCGSRTSYIGMEGSVEYADGGGFRRQSAEESVIFAVHM